MGTHVRIMKVQIPSITVLKNYLFEIETNQEKEEKEWIHFPSTART